MLDPTTQSLMAEVQALLAGSSAPDWRRILKLAETLGGREAEEAFALVLDSVQRFVGDEIDRRKGEGPARLVRLVEAAERIGAAARAAAIYNLDRRPVVLSAFSELAGAMQAR